MTKGLHAQLREAVAVLEACGAAYALIGGLAVVAHGVVRATVDIDFLLAAPAADSVHAALLRHGYDCAFRSIDAANYRRGSQGLDLIYAHRPRALRLLGDAAQHHLAELALPVVGIEGLVGLKLQALANAPQRWQDLNDIRALLLQHRDSLDLEQLRDYFSLFGRQDLYDELIGR